MNQELLTKRKGKTGLNVFAQVVMFAYLVIMVLKYFSILPLLASNLLIIAVGAVGIVISMIKNGIAAQEKVFIFVLLYMLFGVISLLYNDNADVQELLWPFGTMGIRIMLLNFTIPYRTMLLYYYAFCGVFIVIYFLRGTISLVDRVSSRNAVSILTLLVFGFLMISAYENRKTVSLDVPLIFFFVCFLAVGRGGILLALLVLALFMVFRFQNGRSSLRKWYALPLYALGLVIVYLLIMRFVPRLIEDVIENFESKQLQSLRSQIWREYISKTSHSFSNILFGAPVSGNRILDRYTDNLHNSFLALHSKYGIAMLLSVAGMLLSSLIRFIQKKNYYFLIVFLAILFRMNFEYCDFNGCIDNLLIYLWFYYANVGKRHPSLRKDYVAPHATFGKETYGRKKQ